MLLNMRILIASEGTRYVQDMTLSNSCTTFPGLLCEISMHKEHEFTKSCA